MTLKVEEMHCMNCVKRIGSALQNEGIAFEINLEEKSVRIDNDKAYLVIDMLDNLGFNAIVN